MNQFQAFGVMFVAVSLFIGFLFAVQALTNAWNRLTADTPPAEKRQRPQPAERSRRSERPAIRANVVRQRSARPNAEKQSVQPVQPFAERSETNAAAPAKPAFPASNDELQRLTHVIILYAKRPNKEAAILEVTGFTKGESEGYQRFSALFDAAMSEPARADAKAKPEQILARQRSATAPPEQTKEAVTA